MRLNNKVALVTGGTRGIGAGIAQRFAREGAHVVVTGRSVDNGEALVAALLADGGRATFLPADLAVQSEVRHLIEVVVRNCGGLDVLVNNAGPTDLLMLIPG